MEYLILETWTSLVLILVVLITTVAIIGLKFYFKNFSEEINLLFVVPLLATIFISVYLSDCLSYIDTVEKELPSISIDYSSTCLLIEEEFTQVLSENDVKDDSIDEIVSLVNEDMSESTKLLKDDSNSTGAYYLTYTANSITKNDDIPASLAISDTIPVTVSVIRDEVTVACGSPLDPIRELWVLELISYDGESLEPYTFSWSVK